MNLRSLHGAAALKQLRGLHVNGFPRRARRLAQRKGERMGERPAEASGPRGLRGYLVLGARRDEQQAG